MRHKKIRLALVLLASSIVTSTAQASLEARTGGMVYDKINKITWAADANLFKTQAAADSNLVNEIIVNNNGVINDASAVNGSHTLTAADFNTSTGKMTWFGAQAWVNNLTLGGFTDWRLPIITEGASGGNPPVSEMVALFANGPSGGAGAGNGAGAGTGMTNNGSYNIFTNVQSSEYWLGSEYASSPGEAWLFLTTNGTMSYIGKLNQNFAWAVRSGDVAAVPLPGAVWLFGSALVGLIGLKRRKNIV
ncbi:DUF1566 domain-containing protein [Methylobacter sp. S3L5C]|uniref:Lcl domain-containing protein n=1 Tax=Methylobacter sp. S3L5C TaxID=2839024 RepID=UPI001FAE615D|nr:DUF1566 domain-containing protein [Methylobacter sp. S3L5C]UOA09828.1 DUF1566 domain-containing protein [Methylobacter sp. S3L5C]